MPGTRLVVTVAQEEGSDGREIAKQLAQSLQLNYIDEAVIQLATEKFTHSQIETYIRELARQGRVLFVGCGANFVLQDFKEAINLLICAPLTSRIERLMRQQHLERCAAEQRLNELDERYASYIRHYYGPEWTNPDLYDLMINTKTAPIAALAFSLGRFIQTLDQNRYTEQLNSLQASNSSLIRHTSTAFEQSYYRVGNVVN